MGTRKKKKRISQKWDNTSLECEKRCLKITVLYKCFRVFFFLVEKGCVNTIFNTSIFFKTRRIMALTIEIDSLKKEYKRKYGVISLAEALQKNGLVEKWCVV